MLKRWMCAGMCIVLLFMAGCQRYETVKNEKPDNAGKDGFILGQDDQSDLHNGMFPCLQMEDGYLLGLSNMLEYFDRKTKKTVPFCSRADCQHETGSDCSARQEVGSLGYYNGKIYYVCGAQTEGDTMGMSLYRMNKDGTEKEKLYDYCMYSLDELGRSEGVSANVCFHRGYMYYEYKVYNKDTERYSGGLARRKLEKDAEEELVYVEKSKNHWVYSCGMVKGYGNRVYFENTGNNDKTNGEQHTLLSYSVESGEVKVLAENDSEQGLYYRFAVINGDVYYKLKDEVVRIDSQTGQETVVFDTQDLQGTDISKTELYESWMYGDGTYLYLDNTYVDGIEEKEKRLVVLDSEGRLADVIKTGDKNAQDTYFLGSDDTILLFYRYTETGYSCFYYEKDRIGSGKYEMHEILTGENDF